MHETLSKTPAVNLYIAIQWFSFEYTSKLITFTFSKLRYFKLTEFSGPKSNVFQKCYKKKKGVGKKLTSKSFRPEEFTSCKVISKMMLNY